MLDLLTLLPLIGAFVIPDGTYRQDCRGTYQREESIQGNAAVFSETNFWRRACEEPSLRTRSYGELEYGEAPLLDFIFRRVTITPLDAVTAEQMRALGSCGLRDWQEGEEKDVTGTWCRFGEKVELRVPEAGERRYGIYDWKDGELFFGRLEPRFDGRSPGRRPLYLDPSPYRLVP